MASLKNIFEFKWVWSKGWKTKKSTQILEDEAEIKRVNSLRGHLGKIQVDGKWCDKGMLKFFKNDTVKKWLVERTNHRIIEILERMEEICLKNVLNWNNFGWPINFTKAFITGNREQEKKAKESLSRKNMKKTRVVKHARLAHFLVTLCIPPVCLFFSHSCPS